MRVLLTAQFSPASSASERHCRQLAAGLALRGHDVRLLVTSDRAQPQAGYAVRVLLCRPGDPAADLAFPLPTFAAGSSFPGTSFGELSSQQLADYRQEFRQYLDQEVAEFDPQIIHSQHIWLEGQLALETGVPYLLTGWEPELDWWPDPRFYPLVEQAAENASRIVVHSQALAERIASQAEGVKDRLVVLAEVASSNAAELGRRMEELYRAAFRERFDLEPE